MFSSAVLLLSRASLRWVYLTLAVSLGVIVIGFVDLTPRVGSDFFFSTDDPKLRADAQIDRIFESGPQIIVSAASPATRTPAYTEQIGRLSSDLKKTKGVSGVWSITSGPVKVESAFSSPLWRRLLVAPDEKATSLIIQLGTDDYSKVVPVVEKIVHSHERPGFSLAISGVPFVVEQISRNLLQDLRTFGLAALVVFSLLIIIVFRSLQILLGALSACAIAAFLTLLAGPALGMPPGILTPNVSTIIFVLTLSHIMFLAANWTNAARQENGMAGTEELMRKTIAWTVPGSFWSMAANLLGFLTLLLVAAKPIRQFGISCSIGAIIAFATAYLVFPSFLRAVSRAQFERWPGLEKLSGFLGSGRHTWALVTGAVLAAVAIPGLWRLNTDPSLLAYFKEGERSAHRPRQDRSDGRQRSA